MLAMVASFVDAYKKKKIIAWFRLFAIKFISVLKLRANKHYYKPRRKSVFDILYNTIVRSDTFQAYLKKMTKRRFVMSLGGNQRIFIHLYKYASILQHLTGEN